MLALVHTNAAPHTVTAPEKDALPTLWTRQRRWEEKETRKRRTGFSRKGFVDLPQSVTKRIVPVRCESCLRPPFGSAGDVESEKRVLPDHFFFFLFFFFFLRQSRCASLPAPPCLSPVKVDERKDMTSTPLYYYDGGDDNSPSSLPDDSCSYDYHSFLTETASLLLECSRKRTNVVHVVVVFLPTGHHAYGGPPWWASRERSFGIERRCGRGHGRARFSSPPLASLGDLLVNARRNLACDAMHEAHEVDARPTRTRNKKNKKKKRR